MLKPLLLNGQIVGHMAQVGRANVFFGTRFGELNVLEKHFGIRIVFLKQVHGDKFVKSAPGEADAHWTDQGGSPLGIYTADCLPIMMSCSSTKRIIAIHAGWRGIKSQIVLKTKHYLFDTGSKPSDLFVATGPHIGERSFEIETVLAKDLLLSDPLGATQLIPHTQSDKSYVSLLQIAKNQLSEIPPENFIFSQEDTLKNHLYFSYRREKKASRLINFIIQK